MKAASNRGLKENKNSQKKSEVSAVALLVAIGLSIWVYNAATSDDSSSNDGGQKRAAVAAKSNAPSGFDVSDHYIKNSDVPTPTCKPNLACWSDRFLSDAEVLCKPAIEQNSLHEAKWTDGWSNPMFSRFGWGQESSDQPQEVIRYIGDAVEFQNGFGAFTPMSYVCAFDTSKKQVVEVNVYEGRLSNN